MSTEEKTCNCLKTIEEKLTKHHGEGSAVEFELVPTMIMDPDAENYEMGAALAPLYYTYKPPKGKRKRSYVTFNFCPFCGGKAK
jgi:hypothetical protein